MPVNPMATYLYCVLRATRAPALRDVPAGLPRCRKPRALDAGGDTWCIVADAPLARYGDAPLAAGLRDLDWVSRCAAGHQAVIEHFLDADALLPCRLFTLFLGDERAVRHLARRRRTLARRFDRVAGCVELGVRIALDRAPAPRSATVAHTGTAFLRTKQTQRDLAGERAAAAAAAADRAIDELATLAREHVERPVPDGARLLIDAALLVPRPQVRALRALTAKLARRAKQDGLVLTGTGPWPPYSFAALGQEAS